MEVRIQKYFTDCGVLSRRAAEAEIAAGHVTVNGVVATVGQRIDTELDIVVYKGKRLELPAGAKSIYIMLNKPRGYVTTTSDEKGRRCVTELVADAGARVYPVGRLDMDSDGLLLLTNDGELTNFLTHPRHEIPKVYSVRLKGRLSPDRLTALGAPVEIDGMRTRQVKVDLTAIDKDSCTVEMTLFEGRNRQIRRMCEAHGVEIIKLTRIAVGDIKLGKLPVGQWKYLTPPQVRYLKSSMASYNEK